MHLCVNTPPFSLCTQASFCYDPDSRRKSLMLLTGLLGHQVCFAKAYLLMLQGRAQPPVSCFKVLHAIQCMTLPLLSIPLRVTVTCLCVERVAQHVGCSHVQISESDQTGSRLQAVLRGCSARETKGERLAVMNGW
mmetsp:Transcript_20002/g.27125  ORF Transcript_20002/g.27125 Transcript_20002/m.27125 type:complete len:136 (-) Transcript_20002:120-527(-)